MPASLGEIKKLRGLPEGVALYLCSSADEGAKASLELQREVTLHLLQYALEPSSPPVLEHRPNGAPYLPAYPDLSISVSHTRGLVSILLAPSPWAVGVDVERLRPQLFRVQGKYLHEGECALLSTYVSKELTALTLLWSAKEALFKMLQPPSQSLLDFQLVGVQLEGEYRGTLLFSYGALSRGIYHLSYEIHENYVLCYCLEARSAIES